MTSYTDDGGYKEGPVTTSASPVVRAAAPCASPTLTGGAAVLLESQLSVATTSRRGGVAESFGFEPEFDAGRLEDAAFTTSQMNDYTIDDLREWILDPPDYADTLWFGLDSALTAAEKRQLSLYICDKAFKLNDTESGPSADNTYTWVNSGLDWSDIATRTIRIVQDSAALEFVSATVNDQTLVITFSEELGAAASLANSAFAVKKTPAGGSQTDVTLSTSEAPAISGKTVTLKIDSGSAVVETDEDVTVAYTKPNSGTANKIVDLFGNEADTFTAEPVENELGKAPLLTGNLEQIRAGDFGTASWRMVQTFTTGRNVDGYALEEVAISLDVTTGPTAVKVWTLPPLQQRPGRAFLGVELATLTAPDSYGSGEQEHVFKAETPVHLAPETSYAVLVEGGDADWSTTSSNAEDDGGPTGFAVRDAGLQVSASQASARGFAEFSGGAALRMAVRGRVNPVLQPFVSNVGQEPSRVGENLSTYDFTQAFTTGGSSGDSFAVAAVEVGFNNDTPETLTLHSDSGDGTKLADFTAGVRRRLPGAQGWSLRYVPTEALTLDGATTY